MMKPYLPRVVLPLLAGLLLLAGSTVQAQPAPPATTTPASIGTCQPVAWTHLQNAVANGGTLTRTSPGYIFDSAGYSNQALYSDGSLSVTADNTTDFRMVGFTQADAGATWQDYEYAWYIAGDVDGHHSLQMLERGHEAIQIDDYTLGDNVTLTISDHVP